MNSLLHASLALFFQLYVDNSFLESSQQYEKFKNLNVRCIGECCIFLIWNLVHTLGKTTTYIVGTICKHVEWCLVIIQILQLCTVEFFVLFLSMLQLNLFLLAIWLRSTYTSKKLVWLVYKPTWCNTHQILRDTYQTHIKTSHTMFWSFGNSNTFRHLVNDCQILRHTSNTLWLNLEIM